LFLQIIKRYRSGVLALLLCGFFLNLLTFAGSIYMLLVYDSVLPSRSIASLVGLFVMLLVIYGFQYVFELIRSEASLGIANAVRDDLVQPMRYAMVNRSLKTGKADGDGMQPMRDLDQIHSYLAGAGPNALIDLPWVIVFMVVLALLHWTLGVTALVGTIILAAIAIISGDKTQKATQSVAKITGQRGAAIMAELRFAEGASAMGMQERLAGRSASFDGDFVDVQNLVSRTVARFGGAGRVFRLFIQSMILTVGAALVIDGKASGGVILAASVLAGRALAPVDVAIANWRGMVAAQTGWERMTDLLGQWRKPSSRSVELDAPTGHIVLRDVWIAPPGTQKMVLGGVNLIVEPGQALALIGPSGAGKTSLAKAILGIWPLARGEVRLDGATHDQWDADTLGASFGYVPQAVEMIDGTVGENIARFDPAADSDKIIAASRAASLHEMILAMPEGYETRLSGSGGELSAGQRQRIGLARALYGDPWLLVLDEANSNLDAVGDEALARAIQSVKQRKGIVIMITHRATTLGPATHIALLNEGRLADYGLRDEVLKRMQPQQPKVVQAR
jgi:ATP-binding cassette, subfamily C, bacterial PrsD